MYVFQYIVNPISVVVDMMAEELNVSLKLYFHVEHLEWASMMHYIVAN